MFTSYPSPGVSDLPSCTPHLLLQSAVATDRASRAYPWPWKEEGCEAVPKGPETKFPLGG